MTAGALRLFAWSRKDEQQREAHAFDDRAGFVHRSLCDLERWSVRRVAATSETPRCELCAAIVRGAVHRALLEAVPVVPTLSGIEQYQAESR